MENKSDKKKLLEDPTPIKVADWDPGISFSGVGNTLQVISKYVIFSHGDHVYQFQYSVSDEGYNESQYNRMVESIKFLD